MSKDTGLRVREITVSGLLVALALGLSYGENLLGLGILIPLPGVKLGLANLVSIVALYLFGWRLALGVVVVRCVLGAMFGGGVSALLFSLLGGILAFLGMLAMKNLPIFSVYGVSIVGSACHHIGQIFAAWLLFQSKGVVYYLPFLLGAGILTGFLMGLFSSQLLKRLPPMALGEKRRECQ